jgi:hypothetical protein
VDPKTSSLRPKAGSPAEDSKTNSPKRPTPPQEPQTSLSTTEISELVEEVLNHSLEPAITRVLSAALLTKNKKARKRSCPLSDALRTSVRSVLENDPGVLAAIQDRLGTTEGQDETITEEDVVELIREECLTLVRGFSDTAQVPEAAPSRPLKRRKRQEVQPTWWGKDTQRLSGELKQCVTAQVKQQLEPLLDALVEYLEAQGSAPEPSKVAVPPPQHLQPVPYWSPQLAQQQGLLPSQQGLLPSQQGLLPSQLPVYTGQMTFPPQQPQQMVPSQNIASPGFQYCLPYPSTQQVPATTARPDALQAATLLQVLRALRD